MARILIIDDEKDILETLGVLLKSEGHEIIAVHEGLEAIKRLESLEHFDVMVTDLRMTPVDGLELIALARRERPKMGVVIVSAYLDDDTIRRAADLGCTACVRKPFTLEDILDPIRETVAGRAGAS